MQTDQRLYSIGERLIGYLGGSRLGKTQKEDDKRVISHIRKKMVNVLTMR